MKEFIKLIVPEPLEIIFFSIIAIILLVLQNIGLYIKLIDGQNPDVVANFGGVEQYFDELISRIESYVDPTIADMVLWMLIGAISFVAISFITAAIKSYQDEHALIEYYRSPNGRQHEIISYISKIALRVIGVLGFVVWTLIFFKQINPALTSSFFAATITPTNLYSWAWFFVCIICMALALYVFALFIRLAVLKERVFEQID
jgi:hypothetical protein